MSNRIAKKAPIVRLPPKSNVELLVLRSAQVAVIVMGFVTAIFALQQANTSWRRRASASCSG